MADPGTTATKEYMIAVVFDRVQKGTTFIGWPMHLTVLPWFQVTEILTAEVAIYRVLRQFSSFEVQVGEDALFGPQKQVPVHTIQYSETLKLLHEALLQQLQTAGAVLTSLRYTGSEFLPHVTKKIRKNLQPGQSLSISQLCLIEAPIEQDRRTRTKTVLEIMSLHE